MDWFVRIKIASGVAKGLEYLHDQADPPIIFRDLKSSNILLDEDFNPKLSDFGLAKLGPGGDKSPLPSRVMGTYGYSAPIWSHGYVTGTTIFPRSKEISGPGRSTPRAVVPGERSESGRRRCRHVSARGSRSPSSDRRRHDGSQFPFHGSRRESPSPPLPAGTGTRVWGGESRRRFLFRFFRFRYWISKNWKRQRRRIANAKSHQKR